MKVGIFTNCNKDIDLSVTKRLINLLSTADFDVFLHSDIIEKGVSGKSFDIEYDNKLDVMLTVGGDGTILRIASYCAKYNTAILGINLGNVGFLTEIEIGALDTVPELLSKKMLIKEKRSLLCVKVNGKPYYGLNDVVLSRDNSERMIGIKVEVNERLADKYSCDGYIVCTPTGSTAYSLSAGGCILAPDALAMALVPINSHSLHSRPIIVSDSAKVGITLISASDCCSVIVDGRCVGRVKNDEKLCIQKADKELVFLRLKSSNFYEKLLSKLNSWSVTLR